jgi:hypothetical protein
MNIPLLRSLALVALLPVLSFAAPPSPIKATGPLNSYAKNLARHHIGANLFVFDSTNQAFVPTEAAAAWLDDDIATGWPALTGQHYYLLAMPEPELLTNFAISARPTTGTVTLYAGDEAAPPSAKSWTLLAKDVPVDSINDKKLEKPFSRYAKYLLIETNLTDSRPWYSLHLYGDKAAVSCKLAKREKSIDPSSIMGPYVNNQTAFNLSSLYANARVSYAAAADSYVSWQRIIDDNPQSSIAITPSTTDAGLVIKYGEPQAVQRVSILADAGARGKLDFYLVADAAAKMKPTAANTDSPYIKASYDEKAATEEPSAPVSLSGLTPVASMIFDGVNTRNTIDFPSVKAGALLVRWTPDTAGAALPVREINSFANLALSDFDVVSSGAIGELGMDVSGDGKEAIGDGKEAIGDGKEAIGEGKEPIGQFLPSKDPFLPRGLGFPPNLTQADEPQAQPVSP